MYNLHLNMIKQLIPPQELIYDIKKFQKYKTDTETTFRLLNPSFYVDIKDNEYCEYFIRNVSSYENKKYFKHYSLYVNEISHYIKKTNHIPFEHIQISITKNIYKTHKQSNVSFVEEIVNNEIHTYYFQIDSKYNEHDIMIKEEIISLLSLFN